MALSCYRHRGMGNHEVTKNSFLGQQAGRKRTLSSFVLLLEG